MDAAHDFPRRRPLEATVAALSETAMAGLGSTVELPLGNVLEVPAPAGATAEPADGPVARVRRALEAVERDCHRSGVFVSPADLSALELRARALAARGGEFAGIRLSHHAARLAG
jgi:hypothetical protein